MALSPSDWNAGERVEDGLEDRQHPLVRWRVLHGNPNRMVAEIRAHVPGITQEQPVVSTLCDNIARGGAVFR